MTDSERGSSGRERQLGGPADVQDRLSAGSNSLAAVCAAFAVMPTNLGHIWVTNGSNKDFHPLLSSHKPVLLLW
jgi:hypothetical protein